MNILIKKYLSIMTAILCMTFIYNSASFAGVNTNLIEQSGTIDYYDRKAATLTVDDMTFFVDSNVTILNSKGVKTTSFQLTKGTKVKFEYMMYSDSRQHPSIAGVIQTIWVP